MTGKEFRKKRIDLCYSQREIVREIQDRTGYVTAQSTLSTFEKSGRTVPEYFVTCIEKLPRNPSPTKAFLRDYPEKRNLFLETPKKEPETVPDSLAESLNRLGKDVRILSKLIAIQIQQKETDDFSLDDIEDPVLRGFLKFIDKQAKGKD